MADLEAAYDSAGLAKVGGVDQPPSRPEPATRAFANLYAQALDEALAPPPGLRPLPGNKKIPHYYRAMAGVGEQIAESIPRGFGHLTEQAGGLLEWLGQPSQPESTRPVGEPFESRFGTVSRPRNAGSSSLISAGRYVQKKGRALSEAYPKDPYLSVGLEEDPAKLLDPMWLAANVPDTAVQSSVFFIPGMGGARGAALLARLAGAGTRVTGIATFLGGAVAGAEAESRMEAAGTFLEMKEAGKSDEDASKAAEMTYRMNFPLVAGTGGIGFFGSKIPAVANALKKAPAVVKVLGQAGFEGGQEVTQEKIQSVATGRPMQQPLTQGVLGGIVGAGMGAVTDLVVPDPEAEEAAVRAIDDAVRRIRAEEAEKYKPGYERTDEQGNVWIRTEANTWRLKGIGAPKQAAPSAEVPAETVRPPDSEGTQTEKPSTDQLIEEVDREVQKIQDERRAALGDAVQAEAEIEMSKVAARRFVLLRKMFGDRADEYDRLRSKYERMPDGQERDDVGRLLNKMEDDLPEAMKAIGSELDRTYYEHYFQSAAPSPVPARPPEAAPAHQPAPVAPRVAPVAPAAAPAPIAPDAGKVAKLVLSYTGGSGNVEFLTGHAKASVRKHLIEAATGEKVKSSKAGITALRQALYGLAGIDARSMTPAEASSRLVAWIKDSAAAAANVQRETSPAAPPAEPLQAPEDATPRPIAGSVVEATQAQKQPDVAPHAGAVQTEGIAAREPVKPIAVGKEAVVTAGPVKVKARYAIVDADSVLTSSQEGYPPERQPRERGDRLASEMQINAIARAPDFDRLRESPTPSPGAPIIDSQGVADNNGRIEALRRMYEKYPDKADAYRADLLAHAQDLGLALTPEQLSGKPLLVRIRDEFQDAATTRQFIEEANRPEQAGMSAPEQAKVDAGKITPGMVDLLAPGDGGNLLVAQMIPFLREFQRLVLAEGERGAFMDANGMVSADGIRRVRNAIFAKAFGDTEVLRRATESTDDNVKSVTNALINVAPKWIQMRIGIEEGSYHPLDISNEIAEAVAVLSHLRSERANVSDWVNQLELMGPRDPVVTELVAAFGIKKNGFGSTEKLTDLFDNYVLIVDAAGSPAMGHLFGVTPTKSDSLASAIKLTRRQHGAGAPLFETEAGSSPAPDSKSGAEIGGKKEVGPGYAVEEQGPRYSDGRVPRDDAGAKGRGKKNLKGGRYSGAKTGDDPSVFAEDDFLQANDLARAQAAAYFDEKGKARPGVSNLTTPAEAPDVPEGAWRISALRGVYGREIEQYRLLDPNELEPSEDPISGGRGEYVDKYREWIRQGKTPPPIVVVETDGGKLRVVDGHRRWMAAKREGVKVPAWVSPSVELPGSFTPDGQPIRVGLTRELTLISRILADGALSASQMAEIAALRPEDGLSNFVALPRAVSTVLGWVNRAYKGAASAYAKRYAGILIRHGSADGRNLPSQRGLGKRQAAQIRVTLDDLWRTNKTVNEARAGRQRDRLRELLAEPRPEAEAAYMRGVADVLMRRGTFVEGEMPDASGLDPGMASSLRQAVARAYAGIPPASPQPDAGRIGLARMVEAYVRGLDDEALAREASGERGPAAVAAAREEIQRRNAENAAYNEYFAKNEQAYEELQAKAADAYVKTGKVLSPDALLTLAKGVGLKDMPRRFAELMVEDQRRIVGDLPDAVQEHFDDEGQGGDGFVVNERPIDYPSTHEQLSFVYEGAETRPGTTEAQKSLGIQALRGLSLRLQRAGASILGSSLWKGFTERLGSELLGHKVRYAHDLAILAQILRDPRFETLRFFFVKAGQVVMHTAWSARLPGVAAFGRSRRLAIAIRNARRNNVDMLIRRSEFEVHHALASLRKMMDDSGADGWYLLHNHPSGKSTPSSTDVETTQSMARLLPGFKGHVVIDHGEYSTIDAEGRQSITEIASPDDPDPEVAHPLLGKTIKDARDLVGIARALESSMKPGFVVLVARSHSGAVRGLAEVPVSALSAQRRGRTLVTLRRYKRAAAAYDLFLVDDGVGTQHDWLIENGMLADVVDAASGQSRRAAGVPGRRESRYGYPVWGVRVEQNIVGYGEHGPVWYRLAHKVIDEKMGRSSTAGQVLSMLKNAGVKAEEIEWTGLREILGGDRDRVVTKEEALAAVNDGVKVFEKVARPTVYFDLQTPGGRESRELKLLLAPRPSKGGVDYYFGPHFREGNILAWARFNERDGADGKRVLFIEEIQSDWHQKARQIREDEIKRLVRSGMSEEDAKKAVPADYGYVPAIAEEATAEEIGPGSWRIGNAYVRDNPGRNIEGHVFKWESTGWAQSGRDFPGGGRGYRAIFQNDAKNFDSLDDAIEWVKARQQPILDRIASPGSVPDAPFKSTWPALTLRRIIRYAAENNFDRIAWTTGAMQVDRYEEALRKAVDRIEWTKTKDGVHLVGLKMGTSGRDKQYLDHVRAQTLLDVTLRALGLTRQTIDDTLRGQNGWLDVRRVQTYAESLAAADERRVGIERAIEDYRAALSQPLPAPTYEKVVDTTEKETALSDAIGKALSEKILSDPNESGEIEGKDLKIDDTGMAGFYDRMLPAEASKIIRKWGGKIEKTNVNAGYKDSSYVVTPTTAGWAVVDIYSEPGADGHEVAVYETEAEALADRRMIVRRALVHSFDITPSMRDSAVRHGMALFQQTPAYGELETYPEPDDSGADRGHRVEVNEPPPAYGESEEEAEPQDGEPSEFVRDLVNLVGTKQERYEINVGKEKGGQAYANELGYEARREIMIASVQAEIGKVLTFDGVFKFLERLPYVTEARAARASHFLRHLPIVGRRFGVAKKEMAALFDAVEGILRLNTDGTPVFGTKIYEKDDEDNVTSRDRFDAETAEANFEALTPQAQVAALWWVQEREQLAEAFGITAGIEGYIHHFWDDGFFSGARKVLFRRIKAPERKHRKEALGFVRDFERAVTKTMIDLNQERLFNDFLTVFARQLTEEVSEENPFRGEENGWKMIPKMRPGRLGVIIGQVAGGRQIPTPLYDDFIRFAETAAYVSSHVETMRDVGRLLKANLILHPATAMRNLRSGAGQYATGLTENVYAGMIQMMAAGLRGDERAFKKAARRVTSWVVAPAFALLPSSIERIPAQLWGARTGIAQEFGTVSQAKTWVGAASRALVKPIGLLLFPFQAFENYFKRAIVIAEARSKGTPLTAEAILATDATFVAAMNAIDAWAYDYRNVPNGLKKFRESGSGAFIMPFVTYPYKKGRMYGRYLNALRALVHPPTFRQLGAQNVAARILTLGTVMTVVGLAFKRMPDDEKEIPFERLDGNLWTLDRTGRMFVGKDEKGRQLFYRTRDDPWFDFFELVNGAGERIFTGKAWDPTELLSGILSEGPLMQGFDISTGRGTDIERRIPTAARAGNIVKAFIPGSRISEDVKKMLDAKVMRPQTFGEALGRGLPVPAHWVGLDAPSKIGLDPVTKMPILTDPTLDQMRFWFGVNIKRISGAQYQQKRLRKLLYWLRALERANTVEEFEKAKKKLAALDPARYGAAARKSTPEAIFLPGDIMEPGQRPPR
jgi:hypothetical protein